MGRSQELKLRARRAVRTILDRASDLLDRAGSLVQQRMARRHRDGSPPAPPLDPVPPARRVVSPPPSPEPSPQGATEPEPAAGTSDLSRLTKAELYRLAQQREIAGRSRLSKDQLVRALESADD